MTTAPQLSSTVDRLSTGPVATIEPTATLREAAEQLTADGIGGYELINSSILFWAAILIIITISFLGTRNMKMVPTGFQNFMELLVEGFIGLTESVGGPAARRFLPLVMTIFLVILLSNWLGILPGVGTIGRIESAEELVSHELHDLEVEIRESQPGLNDEEVEERALTEALAAVGKKKLTVFDDTAGINLIPFGRGEDTKAPLINVIGDAQGVHDIEERLEASTLVTAPLDNDGKEQPELKGKNAGILIPYLRGPNTDLNTTLAIALVAMLRASVCVAPAYSAMRKAGDPGGVVAGPGGHARTPGLSQPGASR